MSLRSVFFIRGFSVLSCTYCVCNIIQSGIYREYCWKTSFSENWTSYFSGTCMRFSVWKAGLMMWYSVTSFQLYSYPMRNSNSNATNEKTLRSLTKFPLQRIVPRMSLKPSMFCWHSCLTSFVPWILQTAEICSPQINASQPGKKLSRFKAARQKQQ